MRTRIIGGALILLLVAGATIWYFTTLGKESTDDAQIDAHVTQVAARVGGRRRAPARGARTRAADGVAQL